MKGTQRRALFFLTSLKKETSFFSSEGRGKKKERGKISGRRPSFSMLDPRPKLFQREGYNYLVVF